MSRLDDAADRPIRPDFTGIGPGRAAMVKRQFASLVPAGKFKQAFKKNRRFSG
jgi:hypothetical protein